MRSVSRNHQEIVKLLIEQGADVNAINDWDYTALKHLDDIRLLLESPQYDLHNHSIGSSLRLSLLT